MMQVVWTLKGDASETTPSDHDDTQMIPVDESMSSEAKRLVCEKL